MPTIRATPPRKIRTSCQLFRPPLSSVEDVPEVLVDVVVVGSCGWGSGLKGLWASAAAGGASTRNVASGAAIVAVPSSRSKPTIPRFARRMTSSPGTGGAQRTLPSLMAKQRQIKIEQRSALAAMQQLETRSNEELEAEQKYRAAAQAILGARAAEKYDAARAREHFRKAIAAARPQERMQLRRMADASLALAERRPDDLKEAVQRLGQEPPSSRQLFILRIMGLLAPAQSASGLIKARGFLLIFLLIAALIA